MNEVECCTQREMISCAAEIMVGKKNQNADLNERVGSGSSDSFWMGIFE